jgi:hypothetical protein
MQIKPYLTFKITRSIVSDPFFGILYFIYDKIDVLTQKTSFIFDKTVLDSTNFKDLTSTSFKESILCLDSLSSNMSREDLSPESGSDTNEPS